MISIEIIKSKPLHSTNETAAILGIKPNTLRIWKLERRNLQPIKVGSLNRYRSEDILAFIGVQNDA